MDGCLKSGVIFSNFDNVGSVDVTLSRDTCISFDFTVYFHIQYIQYIHTYTVSIMVIIIVRFVGVPSYL